MTDLTTARIDTVRKLLEQAPNSAVQSLQSLLASDASSDEALSVVRALVSTESADRQLRDTVLAPIAPLFTPPSTVARLSFPAQLAPMLWRAIKKIALAEVADALERRACGGEVIDVDVISDRLCLAAAVGLRSKAAEFDPVTDRLGGSASDLDRLIGVLELAPLLREALPRLPSWLFNLGGEHDAAIRVMFRRAADQGDEAGFLFMETLLAHLEEPSQILRLVSVVMDRPSDRYLAASELASIGERLLADIDERVHVLRQFDPRRGLEGGVAASHQAAVATTRICEFERQITLSKEGMWGARITAQRRALAAAIEMRLREAESAVTLALPVHLIRQGMKRLRGAPLFDSRPDRAAIDRAMGLLALLDGCRSTAVNGGFGALRAKVVETLDSWLEGYIQDCVELLHKGVPNAADIRVNLDIAAEFIGLVRDPAAADLVRRRAKAA